jgi:hypothetical protein
VDRRTDRAAGEDVGHLAIEVRREERRDRHNQGLPNPGDVKSGTFDPKTGALKLQLGRSDGPAVLITLDGTVTRNTAAGKVSGEPGDGEFKLTRKP